MLVAMGSRLWGEVTELKGPAQVILLTFSLQFVHFHKNCVQSDLQSASALSRGGKSKKQVAIPYCIKISSGFKYYFFHMTVKFSFMR